MDWSNEAYVRLYVRNTTTWRRLGFEGQTMLMHMLRVVDRAGVLDIEDMPPGEAAALHTGAPPDFAAAGMAKILELKSMIHDGTRLVFPNFIEAQEATKSDKQRQKESRERRAVTNRDEPSQIVTKSHVQSQVVTSGHSLLCSAGLNSQHSAAEAERPSARADFGGGKVLREVPREQATPADRGAAWLSKVTSQEPYSVHGKWAQALADLAAKPEQERAIAARILAAEAAKPDVTGKLTPQHVNDYWHMYREGKAPGKFVPRGTQPTAAEPPKTEAGKLLEKVKALERAERACLYDEGAKKDRIRTQINEVFAQMKALEGSDVRRA